MQRKYPDIAKMKVENTVVRKARCQCQNQQEDKTKITSVLFLVITAGAFFVHDFIWIMYFINVNRVKTSLDGTYLCPGISDGLFVRLKHFSDPLLIIIKN